MKTRCAHSRKAIPPLGSCAGTSRSRTPTLTIKKCPRCGEDVEIFSSDVMARCSKCGLTAFTDKNLCVHSCVYAKECVDSELYDKLKNKKEERIEPITIH